MERDDDLEDLHDEDHLLWASSQGSLTNAAADLAIDGDSEIPRANSTGRIMRLAVSPYDTDGDPTHMSPGSLDMPQRARSKYSADMPTMKALLTSCSADVIDKIESVFESMTDRLLSDKNVISVTLKTRRRASRASTRLTRESDEEAPTRQLCFPGKTEDEAWRFSVVIRILELMHEALRSDVVISKRDMYYRDPKLFGSQSHVDRYVDDIAYTFGVPRSVLNVTAAAKGLVAGAVTFCLKDGSKLHASHDGEGMLVPSLKGINSASMPSVKWILVIEKEATFRSIAASPFWDVVQSEGVLITGKGYPDLATRALVRFLSTASPQNGFMTPSIHGLADYDPDGLAILRTYKHGSKALAHESKDHSVANLQWLGLRSEHVHIAGCEPRAAQGLLALTARDRKKAAKMLAEAFKAENDGCDTRKADQFKSELQTMLMLGVKAELQLLDAVPNGMLGLLNAGLCESSSA